MLPCCFDGSLAAQVEKAGEIVEETLFRAFVAVSEYSQQQDPASKRPTLVFDPVNIAVWIKLVKGSQVSNPSALSTISIIYSQHLQSASTISIHSLHHV